MTVLTTITSGTAVATATIYPLTTTFTPPTACSGIQYDETSLLWVVNEFDSSTCLPTGFMLSEASYFSPGLVCPHGYHTACVDSTASSGTTTVTCCPSISGVTLSCKTTISDTSFSSQWCTWTAGSSSSVALVVTSSGATTASVFTARQGLNAWAVRLVYEASDLVATTATATASSGDAATGTSPSTAATATGTATAATTSQASATAASSTSPNTSQGGVSAGAAAGIGIAVAVLLIAAVGGAFLCWQRRRRNKRSANSKTNSNKNNLDDAGAAAAAGGGHGSDGSAQQSPAWSPRELESPSEVAEMYAGGPRKPAAELFTQPPELQDTPASAARDGAGGAPPQRAYGMDQLAGEHVQPYELP